MATPSRKKIAKRNYEEVLRDFFAKFEFAPENPDIPAGSISIEECRQLGREFNLVIDRYELNSIGAFSIGKKRYEEFEGNKKLYEKERIALRKIVGLLRSVSKELDPWPFVFQSFFVTEEGFRPELLKWTNKRIWPHLNREDATIDSNLALLSQFHDPEVLLKDFIEIFLSGIDEKSLDPDIRTAKKPGPDPSDGADKKAMLIKLMTIYDTFFGKIPEKNLRVDLDAPEYDRRKAFLIKKICDLADISTTSIGNAEKGGGKAGRFARFVREHSRSRR